jgi:hypothetical protein
MIRRRWLMWCVGSLMGFIVVSVAAIVMMLQRIEAKNASFQPPMTALERQRLLPTDPVLDAAPKLDGLRYRDEAKSDPMHYSVKEVEARGGDEPLGQALLLHETNLHATAQNSLRRDSQN